MRTLALVAAIVAAIGVASLTSACGNDTPTTPTPSAPTSPTTSTFSSRLTAKGAVSRSFTATQAGTVSVTLTNSGQRAGKETVILYVRDVVATVAPPGKRVKRFAKVYLEPGQSRTLTFTLRRDDLSFIGADGRSTIEPGDFEVIVGSLKDKFTLEAAPGQAPRRGQRQTRK